MCHPTLSVHLRLYSTILSILCHSVPWEDFSTTFSWPTPLRGSKFCGVNPRSNCRSAGIATPYFAYYCEPLSHMCTCGPCLPRARGHQPTVCHVDPCKHEPLSPLLHANPRRNTPTRLPPACKLPGPRPVTQPLSRTTPIEDGRQKDSRRPQSRRRAWIRHRAFSAIRASRDAQGPRRCAPTWRL